MTSDHHQPSTEAELRRLAEAVDQRNAAASQEDIKALSPEEIQRRFHELRVHQIELEMQNLQLRQAHVALDAERTRYYQLYEMAPVGYCTVSESGLIMEANLNASTLLGLARGALVGQMFPRFIIPEDQGIYFLLILQLFKNHEPQAGELRMVKWDGAAFWARLSTTLVHDANGAPVGWIILSDITACKLAEEALRQSEERFRTVLQDVPAVAVQGYLPDGTTQYWNHASELLYGYSAQEAIGRNLLELIILPEMQGEVKQAMQQMAETGLPIPASELLLRRKDGSRVAVFSSHTIVQIPGQLQELFCIDIDLTELKMAEEALRKSKDQLRELNSELEQRVEQRTLELQQTQKQYLHAEKLSAIGKLSASIAHEFNNPLQGILSVLKGLEKRALLEEEDRELLDEAIKEGNRIKALIHSLQDFNRPTAGKKVAMDVHNALESMLLLHRSDFNSKRITVVSNYAEDLPQIMAVPDQIKQVFLNLLTNAADACLKRGCMITISTWKENDRIAVAIKDTGIGIIPSNLENIFQPFFTTKPEIKGTGLGLSVSHGIITNHQGEIRVESQPDEGSTFTIFLPIKSADVDE